MEPIDGRTYTMWGQFVDQSDEWAGGVLHDFGDSMDRAIFGNDGMSTKIISISMRSGGEDGLAFFEVEGEDFTCGSSVEHLDITAGEEGWITLSGYMGHTFRIKKPDART